MKKLLFASLLMTALTACQKPADPQTTTEQTTQTTVQNTTEQTTSEPVSNTDLSAETEAYRAWVVSQIDTLAADTEQFVAYLKAGKLDEAKALYPVARMGFERSEPIAESFGDLDPRIDNREADLEQGEIWSGFHAIEKILWTQNTTDGTQELGDKLVNDVKELKAKIPTADVTPKLMIGGAVDLLNEVTTRKITGEEEIFSKTDLYDFKANIDGAQKIFEILTPKLSAKKPELVADLNAKFDEVNRLLDSHKTGTAYKSYDKLSDDEIKALSEAVNKLGEPLAQMGIIVE